MMYSPDEFFVKDEQLENYGENLARSLKPSGTVAARRFATAAATQLGALSDLHAALSRHDDAAGESGAAEWLLDNWYLAKREGGEAVSRLREAGRLRAFADAQGVRPLLECLAVAFVHAGGGSVTALRCENFLRGVQKVQSLTEKELSLFVPAVRCALVGQIVACVRQKEDEKSRAHIRDGMARAFSSLRLLSTLDLSDVFLRVDRTEQILRCDPAGEYPKMDAHTRRHYRREVEHLARRHGWMEHRVAARALELAQNAKGDARHVGYFLFTRPLGEMKQEKSGGLFLAARLLLTLFLSLLAGFLTKSALASVLLLIPLSELVHTLLDYVLLHVLPPAHVPRMELENGIPPEGKTICAVTALISDEKQGESLARRLEEYRLANRDAGENLLFAVLADLPESGKAQLPEAQKWIDAAAKEITALNAKYGGGFYLLCRERVYCERDGKYRGWERKRGAIIELAQLLHGGSSTLYAAAGDEAQLRDVRYILVLDADTRLCPGTARELVGAMLHPLNRPEVDEQRRVVTQGYGVIAPRMGVELPAAGKNLFTRIFAGQGGMDPYGSSSGEVWMDLLGRGNFAGKGILDVDVFLRCMAGRIPENSVLSHDILEGAYLRCGYMSDVELTDGFPTRPDSWLRRLERWTRGDWQNLPWLFRRGKVLQEAERWRIVDNLRRSLVAPFVFLCIFLGILMPRGVFGIAALAALGAFLINLLLNAAEALVRPSGDARARYHSTVLGGLRGSVLQAASRLLFLPAEAVTSVLAVLTALWRMLVSHRNLLRWQTAAQSDHISASGLDTAYRTLWACPVFGALCAALSMSALGLAAGILWFFAPLAAHLSARERSRVSLVSETERDYLLSCAKEMWSYFETFCTPEEHFLPPDNFQHAPPVGVAHRTSPTNIGLCLLSALAADDLSLAPTHRCMGLISNILDTVERLPKWHGHLYNWIDTRTLERLRPAYVSTVDSGNLAGCLIALHHGLLEKGREDLAARAKQLYIRMDFRPLYDKKRRLFHIGWDESTGALTEGWYDLLSSEARLTGYIAIAKGDVPRNHWRRLSRAQLEKNGYRGMASWTGTVFEYLMPELLLPCWRDSLIYESARFCLYCQKKRTSALGLPWGASESAFSMIDGTLSYRYKAHGVSALALRRGMDEELVIAPYASFLALPFEPEAALRNLRALEGVGARGLYGFWDAVDFTETRLARQEKQRVVFCVMAHHVGMSLIAAANRLLGGVMQRRFMAERAMSAYAGLLQERIPVGGAVLRRAGYSAARKSRPAVSDAWEKSGEWRADEARDCCVLSNGFYNIMLTANGEAEPSCRELMPYLGDFGAHGARHGIAFFLETKTGRTPLLPVPEADKNGVYRWAFRADRAEHSLQTAEFSSAVETVVASSEPGERRTVVLQSRATSPQSVRLLVQFEAVLARYNDYVNQPAYYGLGLHARMQDNVLIVRRVARGTLEECHLAFACSAKMDVRALRDRGGGLQIDEAGSWLTSGRMECAIDLVLAENLPARMTFALCVAKTAEGAYAAAMRTLHLPKDDMAALPGVCAALLGLRRGLTGAFELLRCARFSVPDAETTGHARDALWRHGVSGDLPLVSVRMDGEEGLNYAAELVRQHALLSVCGQKFDLVLLDPDGGDYRRAKVQQLWKLLRELERENSIDARGGVHFVADTPENRRIFAGAGVVLPEDTTKRSMPAESIMSTEEMPLRSTGKLRFDFAADGSFCFDASGALPPRAWSQVLTNGAFGCLMTECGAAHMWFHNAREAQLTRWTGDVFDARGAERLCLRLGGEVHSLFAAPGDGESIVEYDFGCATWQREFHGIRVRTSAFVPLHAKCRVLLIETEGTEAEDACIEWQLTPFLASGEADQTALRCRREGDMLVAENPRFLYPQAQFRALASQTPLQSACDAQTGSSNLGAGKNACFFLRLQARGVTVIVCGMDAPDKLHILAQPETAKRLLAETRQAWSARCRSFTVHTPDPLLDRYLNGWAVYQTLACRVLGRCSAYQSGGAFGFRDQLQDAVNLLPLMPEICREQLLRACAHQFSEGDVLHWWHACPTGDRGVRTRCSDDLLWLPWAICEYTDSTGDLALCAEQTPFLRSAPLRDGEENRYDCFARTEEAATVAEHGFRALEMVMRRGTGAHGLILMLGGDWNDGFDRVGAAGRGESVWLSWFFAHTASRFAALAERLQLDSARTARLHAFSRAVGEAANATWDGGWYLRGYFDDGTPLGGEGVHACRIDSVAQSFSALCAEAEPTRVDTALQNALRELYDREKGVVHLFVPPFENDARQPGYITGYGPGFRENGGQYTHGAVWLAMALLLRGDTDAGYAVLHALLPGARDWENYGAEPYVLSADVYTAPGHEGRAGWSWYTGSAGWFFRVALRELLGLKMVDGRMHFAPRLPSAWNGFSVEYTDGNGQKHRLEVTHEATWLDGKTLEVENGKEQEKCF